MEKCKIHQETEDRCGTTDREEWRSNQEEQSVDRSHKPTEIKPDRIKGGASGISLNLTALVRGTLLFTHWFGEWIWNLFTEVIVKFDLNSLSLRGEFHQILLLLLLLLNKFQIHSPNQYVVDLLYDHL